MRSPDLLWPDARAAVRDAAASDPAAAATVTPMPWDRQQRAAALASVAMAVPERVVTNATVAEGAGVTEQWIVHRTGVHERRHVSDGERLQDLATAAGRAALEEANVAAGGPGPRAAWRRWPPDDHPAERRSAGGTRPRCHARGRDGRGGGLHGLPVRAGPRRRPGGGRPQRQRARDRRRGAQPLRRPLGPRHGRAVRGRRGRRGGGALERATATSPTSSCTATRPEPTRSAPRTTSRSSTCRATTPSRRRSSGCPRRASRPRSARACELDEIDLFVYHQANARILTAVGERLGLDSDRVINCIDRYGNTSSATLPIALADARERGMLEPGMNVLLSAFGAGFTWGAGVIEWGA